MTAEVAGAGIRTVVDPGTTLMTYASMRACDGSGVFQRSTIDWSADWAVTPAGVSGHSRLDDDAEPPEAPALADGLADELADGLADGLADELADGLADELASAARGLVPVAEEDAPCEAEISEPEGDAVTKPAPDAVDLGVADATLDEDGPGLESDSGGLTALLVADFVGLAVWLAVGLAVDGAVTSGAGHEGKEEPLAAEKARGLKPSAITHPTPTAADQPRLMLTPRHALTVHEGESATPANAGHRRSHDSLCQRIGEGGGHAPG